MTTVLGQDTLTTEAFDMNGCVNLYVNGKTRVIKNKAKLDSVIRNDASRERCLKSLNDFDFEQFSLLGINLNTGYCGAPMLLSCTLTKVESENKYVLSIGYKSPIEPCRALSSYDLWIKVPSIQEDYEVEFEVWPSEEW